MVKTRKIVNKDVYPVFEISSIKTRCNKDINQFIHLYKLDHTINIELKTEINYEHMKQTIQNIVDKILFFTKKKSIKQFNYHEINNYKISVQYKLWMLRTYLFYQLLIYSTLIMSNQNLFDEIYSNKKEFRPDIKEELQYFKMGIFGSIRPNSDIDIGIQYSSFKNVNGLSYVVSIFEDTFFIFLGISSLELDIETYADMITIPNPNKESKYKDIFYLDTVNFNKEHLYKMLPYAGASILRNYISAMHSTNIKLIDEFDFSIIKNYFPSFFDLKEVNNILDDYTWQNKAKELVKSYISCDYEHARQKYYELVNDAEKSIKNIKDKIMRNVTPSKNEILGTMMKISESLVFRAESYTCSPTVIHVVRILQANKDHPSKYPTLSPGFCGINKKKAVFSIGKVGYILSILEQIGNMIRYDSKFCKNDQVTCIKKKEKYMVRYNSAINFYNLSKHITCKNTM